MTPAEASEIALRFAKEASKYQELGNHKAKAVEMCMSTGLSREMCTSAAAQLPPETWQDRHSLPQFIIEAHKFQKMEARDKALENEHTRFLNQVQACLDFLVLDIASIINRFEDPYSSRLASSTSTKWLCVGPRPSISAHQKA